MPRVCTVCSHPDRAAIDQALVAGEPNRRIAARAAVSETSIRRHKASCIASSLVKATEAKKVVNANALFAKVRDLEAEARRIGRKAEKEGDLRCAIASVKQILDIVELLARLLDAFPRDGKGMNEGPAGISIQLVRTCPKCGAAPGEQQEVTRAVIQIGDSPPDAQG